jgi:CubicO group peptidase (beta-lactamase class C family)
MTENPTVIGHLALPRTEAVLHQGLLDGLHVGAQLYVSLRGEVIADGALGDAVEGVPMRPDTVIRWLSAGKPVTAVSIAQLAERGLVEYDRPVADYIPGFEQGGKGAVSVRHVLTHTGGFRTAERAAVLPTWEERIAGICAAPIEEGWVPGMKAGYHSASAWTVLGEIVQRVTGGPFGVYLRRAIFEFLGMNDSWTVPSLSMITRYGSRLAELYLTENGEKRLHPMFTTEASNYVCNPGGTLIRPVRELGRFYEALLAAASGVEIPGFISHQSAGEITTPQRVGMLDETFKNVIDWGLGVIMDSKKYGVAVPYGYGPHASPRTFGHGGSQSSTAFADPEHSLVVAIVFNGLPGEPKHDRRLKAVTAAIYEDLGLTSAPQS